MMASVLGYLVVFVYCLAHIMSQAHAAIPEQRPWPSDDSLVGHWNFTSGSTDDLTGNWGSMTVAGGAFSSGAALELRGSSSTSTQYASVESYTGPALSSKTIVSRFKIVNRDAATQGSVGSITTDSESKFDAIVWEEFGENSFFLGSNEASRSAATNAFSWTHNDVELTVAIVMKQAGGSTSVKMYVDGFLRRDYTKASTQDYSGAGVKFLWGRRHWTYGAVSADIYETRLYSRALRESEIVQIVPVQESSSGKYLRATYISGFPGFFNARRMCRGNGLQRRPSRRARARRGLAALSMLQQPGASWAPVGRDPSDDSDSSNSSMSSLSVSL